VALQARENPDAFERRYFRFGVRDALAATLAECLDAHKVLTNTLTAQALGGSPQTTTGDPKVSRCSQSNGADAAPQFQSIEEIAVLLDKDGKIQRMLAHEALGKFGIALFKRFDNAQMIDD
jgi:hypothetical protein